MYIPKPFAEHDRSRMFELMRTYSFATLVTAADNVPQVTHLPFIVDPGRGPNGTLLGHFARGNPHWRSIGPDDRATVIFQGPHSYVSPRWYRDQSNVPTWNYTAVHATGPVEILRDTSAVLDIVSRLTEVHEREAPDPWPVANAERDLDKLLSAIVGFRIPIQTLEGKYKLSQNRTTQDQQGVIDTLTKSEDPTINGVAELMRRNLT